jgi:integration host factor subunit alpha
MTKQELIERIYKKRGIQNGMTKKVVADIIDAVFAELGDYFIKSRVTRNGSGPRFTYPGFGTFAKRQRPERDGRHPQTGEPIRIQAQQTVSFAVGSDLRSLLNRNGRDK